MEAFHLHAARSKSDTASNAYHYFIVPIEVDGKLHSAWFNVREPKAKDKNSDAIFYEFGADAKNDLALTRSVTSHRLDSENRASTSKPTVNVAQFLDSVKGGITDHIPPKPQDNPKIGNSNLSIGKADYLQSVVAEMDKMRRTPKERLEIAEKAKENLAKVSRLTNELERWSRLESDQKERNSKLELDIENLNAERDRQIEALNQRKAGELAKAGEANATKFGDRFEAASTPEERKTLERHAEELASAAKRGIEKDFRHQETAIKEKFRAEERAMRERALGAEKATKLACVCEIGSGTYRFMAKAKNFRG